MSKLSDSLVVALHNHLDLELEAFYFYWAASTQFKNIYSSYPGFAQYFQAESNEERSHAQLIIDFLIKRGHTVNFPHIAPIYNITNQPNVVLSESLMKEHKVLESLEHLHSMGKKDVDLTGFLEEMITEQQNAIAELTRKISEIETLLSDGQIKMGLYLYDKKLKS